MEHQKKKTAEQIWLTYYNTYLYERSLITEQERNRMISLINLQSPK